MAAFGTLREMINLFAGEELVKKGLLYLEGLTPDAPAGEFGGQAEKITIDGDALFALHQSYTTKPLDEGRFEGHRRHIDIQFILKGREIIRVAPLGDATPNVAYDDVKDLAFYPPREGSDLLLTAGMAAVLYPSDLHAPCLQAPNPSPVVKIVIKVRVK